MITVNIIYRVFRIGTGAMSGTAFTIDVDARQYLVTAKHVVPDSSSASSLNVFQSGSWVSLPVSFVGATADDEDITVLAAAQQLTDPTLPVSPTMKGNRRGNRSRITNSGRPQQSGIFRRSGLFLTPE